MASYYYLAAQLPYLTYGQSVPMSSSAFRELAQKHLSSSDMAALEQCTLEPEFAGNAALSSFADKWKEWEGALRLNLAKNRARKLKREGIPAAPDFPFEAASAAKAACAIESPFEAEIFLDKARWDAIESFQGLDIFSEDAIYAYMLKLLLMERRMAFNAEEGYTEYKALYAAILGDQK